MRCFFRTLFILALFGLSFHGNSVFAADILIIANNDVPQTDITSSDLGKIYLGKKKSWDGGKKIVAVTLKSGDTHDSFLSLYVKKSSAQFSTFWKQAIFTGQGLPPKSVGSEEEIVKFVAETSGAIGYISASSEHAGVKVITVK